MELSEFLGQLPVDNDNDEEKSQPEQLTLL